MKKALFYGILASFFFAFTFLLNRSMHLAGGYWLWSACLRYLFTFPILAAVLAISGKKQKSNVTSFLRVALKKHARKHVRKKVKKFAFDHCKTCSERFVI